MARCYKTVLLFGAPGAGKGTQGELLGSIPGFYHLSTGDMFRALDKTSEKGRIFAQYSEKGELVPDEFTIELWESYVQELISSGKYDPDSQLLVLDGIPRTTKQAKLIESLTEVLGIIHLNATDKEAMVERLRQRALQQKRSDDANEEVIRNRLDIYERDTRPVLEQFDQSLVHDIDAMGTMAIVLMHVLDVVAPIHARSVMTVDS